MKILLLSAYDTASHQYWRKGLVKHFPEHDWTVLTLPARYFAWRMRGNSLSWAYQQRQALQAPYDLLIATSMTDLSALRGMVPELCTIPALVYFHENQFAYPLSAEQKHSQVFNQSLNLYTALCADQIAFNSEYNRETFFAGVKQFLKNMPDHVPDNLLEQLEVKSIVLPVPLNDECFRSVDATDANSHSIAWNQKDESVTDRPIRIVWAARWEYDKGPDRLLAMLRELECRGTDFRLCIMGEKFRRIPTEFDSIESEFRHRLDQFGYVDSKTEYMAWLTGSDIILATASHEFQGISVLEAVAAGCIPIVPDRLAYTELFDRQYKYPDYANEVQTEAAAATDLIVHHAQLLRKNEVSAPDIEQYNWLHMKPRYAEIIQQLTPAP